MLFNQVTLPAGLFDDIAKHVEQLGVLAEVHVMLVGQCCNGGRCSGMIFELITLVSGMIRAVVTSLVIGCCDAFVDVILLGMAFDPGD